MKKSLLLPFFGLISVFFLLQCGGDASDTPPGAPNELRIRLEGQAANINPLIPASGYSIYVAQQVFQALGDVDPTTFALNPVMIKTMPADGGRLVEEGPKKGLLAYDFEILDEAVWDNGSPITGKDVEFTLKIIFHPLLPTNLWRGYFENVESVEIDPVNPKKFVVYLNKYYMLGLESLVTTPVYPAYNYDPKGLLNDVALTDLIDQKKAESLAKTHAGLQTFASEFQQEKYGVDKNFISGSSAYKITFFDVNQGVTLERKTNWWGDKAVSKNPALASYPDKLIYKYVKAEDAAVNMLRSGDLDLAHGISTAQFSSLKNEPQLAQKYQFQTQWLSQFNRMAMNMRDPILQDKNVRLAISHAVDYDYLLNEIQLGLATKLACPVNPKHPDYDASIQPYLFDIEKAKSYLAASGWSDSDGDGIADKKIKGVKTDLSLGLMTPAGTPVTDQVAASIARTCLQAGIKINLIPLEFGTLVKNTRKPEFQLAITGAGIQPSQPEFHQNYHSVNLAPRGDNRTGISLPELDRTIDEMRSTSDVQKRRELSRKAQRIIHEEACEVYLYSSLGRFILNNQFEPVLSANSPGYYPRLFKKK